MSVCTRLHLSNGLIKTLGRKKIDIFCVLKNAPKNLTVCAALDNGLIDETICRRGSGAGVDLMNGTGDSTDAGNGPHSEIETSGIQCRFISEHDLHEKKESNRSLGL